MRAWLRLLLVLMATALVVADGAACFPHHRHWAPC